MFLECSYQGTEWKYLSMKSKNLSQKQMSPSLRKKNRGRKFKIELSYSKPEVWLLSATMRQKIYYNFFLLLVRFLNF